MIIRFSSVIRDVQDQESIITVEPVAGIGALRVHDGTRIAIADGSSVTWRAVRPGLWLWVSGCAEGMDASLSAERIIIGSEHANGGRGNHREMSSARLNGNS